MGGGKGSFQQTSTFQPPAWALAGGQQSVETAEQLAQTPFDIPAQPISSLQPQQTQAMQEVQNLQGGVQPYANAATGLEAAGAQPNIGQYFGAESTGVMNELENQNAINMAQVTGNATQTAGGIGADRIGVAQAETANQQNLAAGNTLAQIMGQSVGQAQAGAGLEQSAGNNLMNIGTGAQTANLQGATAELQSGTLAQQQLQNQANSQYENILQQVSWPFQTNQYLGSMSAGVTPAMGGTGITSGNTKSSMVNGSSLGKGLGAMALGSRGGAIGGEEDTEAGVEGTYADGGKVDPLEIAVGRRAPLAAGGMYSDIPNGIAQGAVPPMPSMASNVPSSAAAAASNVPSPSTGGAKSNGASMPPGLQTIDTGVGNQIQQMSAAEGQPISSATADSWMPNLYTSGKGGGPVARGGRIGFDSGGSSPFEPVPVSDTSGGFGPGSGEIVSVPFGPAVGGPQEYEMGPTGVAAGNIGAGLHPATMNIPTVPSGMEGITFGNTSPSFSNPMLAPSGGGGAGKSGAQTSNPFDAMIAGLTSERGDILSQLGAAGGGEQAIAGETGALGGWASAAPGMAGAFGAHKRGGRVHKDGGGPIVFGSGSMSGDDPTIGGRGGSAQQGQSKAQVPSMLGSDPGNENPAGGATTIPQGIPAGHPSPQMQSLMTYHGPNPMSTSPQGGGGGDFAKQFQQGQQFRQALNAKLNGTNNQTPPLQTPNNDAGTPQGGQQQQAAVAPASTPFDTAGPDMGDMGDMADGIFGAASGGRIGYDDGGGDSDPGYSDPGGGFGLNGMPSNYSTPMLYGITSGAQNAAEGNQQGSTPTPLSYDPASIGQQASPGVQQTGNPMGAGQSPFNPTPQPGASGTPGGPTPNPTSGLQNTSGRAISGADPWGYFQGNGAGDTNNPFAGVPQPGQQIAPTTAAETREQGAIGAVSKMAQPTPPLQTPQQGAQKPPAAPAAPAAAAGARPPGGAWSISDAQGRPINPDGTLVDTSRDPPPGTVPGRAAPAPPQAPAQPQISQGGQKVMGMTAGKFLDGAAPGWRNPLFGATQEKQDAADKVTLGDWIKQNPAEAQKFFTEHPELAKYAISQGATPQDVQQLLKPAPQGAAQPQGGQGQQAPQGAGKGAYWLPNGGQGNTNAWRYGSTVVPMDAAKYAIGKFESSNDYGNVTDSKTSLGRALGRYQVMEGQLQQQLKASGLPGMTPEQFLKDPTTQDKLFEHEFGALQQKYGNFNDAASAWLTGHPYAEAGNRRDRFGTDATAYLNRTNANLAEYAGEGGKYDASTRTSEGAPSGGGGGGDHNPIRPPPGVPDDRAKRAFFFAMTGKDLRDFQRSDLDYWERAARYGAINDNAYAQTYHTDTHPTPQQAGSALMDHAEAVKKDLGERAGAEEGQPGTITAAGAGRSEPTPGAAVTPVGGGAPRGGGPNYPSNMGETYARSPWPTLAMEGQQMQTAEQQRRNLVASEAATRNRPLDVGFDVETGAPVIPGKNGVPGFGTMPPQAPRPGTAGAAPPAAPPPTNSANVRGVGTPPPSGGSAPPSAFPTFLPAAPGGGGGSAPAPAGGGAPSPLPAQPGQVDPRTGAPNGTVPQTGIAPATSVIPITADRAFQVQMAPPPEGYSDNDFIIDLGRNRAQDSAIVAGKEAEARTARRSLTQAGTMERDFGKMNESDFLRPGAMHAYRMEVANVVNTVLGMTGGKGAIDEQALASGQALDKLQTTFAQQNVGQEKAGFVLDMVRSATPGSHLTPEGFRNVLSTMKAWAQQTIDESAATSEYARQHYGSLSQFDRNYAKVNPPERYEYMAAIDAARGPQGRRIDTNVLNYWRQHRDPASTAAIAQAWKLNPAAVQFVQQH